VPSILIVEDDRAFQMAYRVQLEPLGYELEIVETAEEALESIERKRFECAIIDLMLPGMDGAELIRYLRTRDDTRTMPMVAFTCMVREMSLWVDESDSTWLPADAVVDKFEGTPAVVQAVEELLERRRGERGDEGPSAGGKGDCRA